MSGGGRFAPSAHEGTAEALRCQIPLGAPASNFRRWNARARGPPHEEAVSQLVARSIPAPYGKDAYLLPELLPQHVAASAAAAAAAAEARLRDAALRIIRQGSILQLARPFPSESCPGGYRLLVARRGWVGPSPGLLFGREGVREVSGARACVSPSTVTLLTATVPLCPPVQRWLPRDPRAPS